MARSGYGQLKIPVVVSIHNAVPGVVQYANGAGDESGRWSGLKQIAGNKEQGEK